MEFPFNMVVENNKAMLHCLLKIQETPAFSGRQACIPYDSQESVQCLCSSCATTWQWILGALWPRHWNNRAMVWGICCIKLHYKVKMDKLYSKTCLKLPLSKRPKIGYQDQLLLNAGQKYCRMLKGEHSAILSTWIKLPSVIKIFVLSIFEWPFYTGFSVCKAEDTGGDGGPNHMGSKIVLFDLILYIPSTIF